MAAMIRKERKRRGWTQEYVAAQIGLTKKAVHLIETRQRNPSYDVLCKLEKLFEMRHNELFRSVED